MVETNQTGENPEAIKITAAEAANRLNGVADVHEHEEEISAATEVEHASNDATLVEGELSHSEVSDDSRGVNKSLRSFVLKFLLSDGTPKQKLNPHANTIFSFRLGLKDRTDKV